MAKLYRSRCVRWVLPSVIAALVLGAAGPSFGASLMPAVPAPESTVVVAPDEVDVARATGSQTVRVNPYLTDSEKQAAIERLTSSRPPGLDVRTVTASEKASIGSRLPSVPPSIDMPLVLRTLMATGETIVVIDLYRSLDARRQQVVISTADSASGVIRAVHAGLAEGAAVTEDASGLVTLRTTIGGASTSRQVAPVGLAAAECGLFAGASQACSIGAFLFTTVVSLGCFIPVVGKLACFGLTTGAAAGSGAACSRPCADRSAHATAQACNTAACGVDVMTNSFRVYPQAVHVIYSYILPDGRISTSPPSNLLKDPYKYPCNLDKSAPGFDTSCWDNGYDQQSDALVTCYARSFVATIEVDWWPDYVKTVTPGTTGTKPYSCY